jgi:hypothetical protein
MAAERVHINTWIGEIIGANEAKTGRFYSGIASKTT